VTAAVLRLRVSIKNVLFWLGDVLMDWSGRRTDEGITRPWLFATGHWVSELGWRFR
jgi:hypothetical protein